MVSNPVVGEICMTGPTRWSHDPKSSSGCGMSCMFMHETSASSSTRSSSSNHKKSNSSAFSAWLRCWPLGPAARQQWLPVRENGSRGAEPSCCALQSPPFATLLHGDFQDVLHAYSMQSCKRIVAALFCNPIFCTKCVG
jgi:hypothetical protein